MPVLQSDVKVREVAMLKDAYERAYQIYMATHSSAGSSCGAKGYNRRDRNGLTVWEKIVMHAHDVGTSPCSLVAVLFGIWESSQPPRPHHLLGDFLVPHLKKYAKRMRDDVRIMLNTDRQAFNIAMSDLQGQNRRRKQPRSPYQLHVAVLANDYLQISQLFRYCLARKLQASEIFDAVRDGADEQFLTYPPAYLSEWSQLLSLRHARMGEIYAGSHHVA